MFDRSRSPAITLHGVVSGANIEVVPLPDGSQIITLGMQASTKNSPSSAAVHESLSPPAFSSACPSRRLLDAHFEKRSAITKRSSRPSARVHVRFHYQRMFASPPQATARYPSPNQPLVWSPKGMLPRIEQVGPVRIAGGTSDVTFQVSATPKPTPLLAL